MNEISKRLEALGAMLESIGAARGFHPLGPPGERHGSWEIALYRRDDLDRFVSLALTEIYGAYEIEVGAGADSGSQFTRHLVCHLNVGPHDANVDRRIRDALLRAIEVAEALQPSDLTEALLPSRAAAEKG